jgi:hypothetical protein
MMAVAPVLVARTMGRSNSSARMRADGQVLIDRQRVAKPADVAQVVDQAGAGLPGWTNSAASSSPNKFRSRCGAQRSLPVERGCPARPG